LALRQKILLGFAALGFFIAPAFLIYSGQVLHERFPNQRLLAILCPPSMLSIAFAGSTRAETIVGWGFLCATNAFIYVLVGIVVALLVAN
jgi:hypothetical protein